jgi:hypothetical protein
VKVRWVQLRGRGVPPIAVVQELFLLYKTFNGNNSRTKAPLRYLQNTPATPPVTHRTLNSSKKQHTKSNTPKATHQKQHTKSNTPKATHKQREALP